MKKDMKTKLIEIHGIENCHICSKPKYKEGLSICSYPHAMVPVEAIDKNHPEGFWSWKRIEDV